MPPGFAGAVPTAISYGFAEHARYRATGIELQDFAATFCVERGDEKLGDATLNVPGKHNVSNALGVIALASELGIPFRKDRELVRHFSSCSPAF
jgi:UDP-N-acetylmuramate-alanine ligase